MDTVMIMNVVLDVILILASIWMVFAIRGIGGIVGQTLTYIVIGAVILGVAHLLATFTGALFAPYGGTVHRVVVLVGFIFLAWGFRQLAKMR